MHIDELWVAFGVKKQYCRYIAIQTIANKLGRENSRALPFFHAIDITGCDTMSFLSSVGKKIAWFPRGYDLGNMPLSLSGETMKHLQRFVILLYDRTSQSTQVDHSRKVLFARGRQIDGIPPTEATLKEHVKRAVYQAGYCWGQTRVANQESWRMELQVKAQFPFLEVTSRSSQSMLRACQVWLQRKSCRRPCKCVSVSLPCTELCNCAATCYQ